MTLIPTRITASALILLMLNMVVGCNYFKVTQFTNPTVLNELKPAEYLIIHMPSDAIVPFHLQNPVLEGDKQTLSGLKMPVNSEHMRNEPPQSRGNSYNPALESPDDEVHIHITSLEEKPDGTVIIDIQNITKVEVYDRQVGTFVASIFAVPLGIITFFSIFLVLSSCPFIYTQDGDEFTFRGEVFGGAIAPNLERDDYMPLPHFLPQDGALNLKITNELKELQHTNVAELLCIAHPEDVEVLMDSYGNPYSLAQPSAPISATAGAGIDYLSEVSELDKVAYLFLDETPQNEDFSHLDLTFDAANARDEAKLVLDLKNTIWMDHIFERYCALFGDRYNEFTDRQRDKSPEKKMEWARNEGILLEVLMNTDSGWETLDYINMVGPLAARSIVVPIDLQDHDSDVVEIRLKSGFHFWEVDYAAMDFSENHACEIIPLELQSAEDETGRDVRSCLAHADGDYLDQLHVGAETNLSFVPLEMLDEHMTTSLFLHTRGYYEYIRDYTGTPNISELREFKKPGTFAHFSKTRISQIAGLNP